jgi:hypothetical protein
VNRREALAAVASLLQDLEAVDLEIDVPEDARVLARVYEYPPPGNVDVETPCIMLTSSFNSLDQRPNSRRELSYTIRLQFLCGDVDTDPHLWAEVAASFHDALLLRLDQSVKLEEDGVLLSNWRGGEERFEPLPLEWNGKGHVGFELLGDLTIHDVVAIRGA